MSTKHLAAGCVMSSNLRIVAPSLEMVVDYYVIILSMPRGPRVVRITSTTALHALILLMIY